MTDRVRMVPRKIISLAPTHTETLYFLDIADKVIGVTENCDYPEEAKSKQTFGSWAYPDIWGVLQARPELVCTFSSHHEELATLLMEKGIKVFHSNPQDIIGALRHIKKLAEITKANGTEKGIESLYFRLQHLQEKLRGKMEKPVVLRILNWDPLITVGNAAFQADVIRQAGGVNVADHYNESYVRIHPEEVFALNPDVIFFCEPELKQKINSSAKWKQTKAVKHGKLFCFPCGLTCRSGPRIVDMAEQLARRLHPDLFDQAQTLAAMSM